jgi:PRTRC genetic system protein E
MFASLASILSANQTLDLSITHAADGSMKVIVKPQLVKGGNISLAIPLALVATPQELDADFIRYLMQYAGERTSLQQQVEVTTTIIAQAKASEVGKASKAMKTGTKPAVQPAGDAGDNDEGDGDGDGDDVGDATGGDDILDDTPASSTGATPPAPTVQQAPAAAVDTDDLLSLIA